MSGNTILGLQRVLCSLYIHSLDTLLTCKDPIIEPTVSKTVEITYRHPRQLQVTWQFNYFLYSGHIQRTMSLHQMMAASASMSGNHNNRVIKMHDIVYSKTVQLGGTPSETRNVPKFTKQLRIKNASLGLAKYYEPGYRMPELLPGERTKFSNRNIVHIERENDKNGKLQSYNPAFNQHDHIVFNDTGYKYYTCHQYDIADSPPNVPKITQKITIPALNLVIQLVQSITFNTQISIYLFLLYTVHSLWLVLSIVSSHLGECWVYRFPHGIIL